jgi:hypothetical protein
VSTYYLVARRPTPVPESALGNAKGAGGRVPRRDSGHNSDPREDEEDRGVDARRAGGGSSRCSRQDTAKKKRSRCPRSEASADLAVGLFAKRTAAGIEVHRA